MTTGSTTGRRRAADPTAPTPRRRPRGPFHHEVPTPWPVGLRVAVTVVAVGLMVHATLVGVQGPGHQVFRDGFLYTFQQWAAALIVLARGVFVRRERWAWLALGSGLTMSAIGDVVYATTIATLDPEPYPSAADALYLMFYPGWYVALILLLRERLRDLPRSLWLDGLISGLALSCVLAAFAYGPVAAGTGGSVAAVVVGLAYPLLDLVLISVVVAGLVMFGWRAEGRQWTVGVALVICGVSDLVYSLQQTSGTYVEGTWLDVMWPLSNLILAGVAWRPIVRVPERDTPGGLLIVTPIVSLCVAIGVMVTATVSTLPTLAVALAAAAMVGVVVRLVSTLTETRRLIATQHQAATDELTGLLNRRAFTARAGRALADAERRATPCALLLLDLDGFKEVNDSLGHAAGDRLLVEVAHRVGSALHGGRDVLGRLGGDEFAVLLDPADQAQAESTCARIAQALGQPMHLDGTVVRPAASIGIATVPEHGTELSGLMRRADIAMYRAKSTRSGHTVFDGASGDQDGEDRLQRIGELEAALRDGGVVLHYQPQIDLHDGGVPAVEALVRWPTRDRGLLLPGDFLPLARQAGLMPRLTAHVLSSAIDQAAAWQDQGLRLRVSVNVEPDDVIDLDLPDRVGTALAAAGLAPDVLTLEVTESGLMADPDRAREVLARLRVIGVQVSVDDYGSGYSSLSYLRGLPIDELKLDRSLVVPIAEDPRARLIVRSTVELAHGLGLRVVAEGVESLDAATALTRLGCDHAQGWAYAPALPAPQLAAWIAARTGASVVAAP